MDIYEILKTDHRQVLMMVDAIEKADEDDRKSILTLIHTELAMHSKAEEEVFYRPLRDKLSSEDIIHDSFDDHDEIDKLIGKLQVGYSKSDAWLENLHQLRTVLQHHIDKEEHQVFTLARQHFSTQEAERLSLQMLAEKGKLGMPNPVTVMTRKIKEMVVGD